MKSQEDYDLLFDKKNLLSKVKLVFEEVGSTELSYSSLWELRRKNYQLIDEYFPEVVLSILRDFTRNDSTIEYEIIYEWVMSPNFEYYQINSIHDLLKDNSKINISEVQMNFITLWAHKVAKRIDATTIVRKTGTTGESFTINQEAQILWLFIKELDINLPQEHLLKFTLFGDFSRNVTDNSHDIIDHLCKLVDSTIINIQIIDNLKNGISVSWVWKCNSLYALDNNLDSIYSKIVENIMDDSKSEYQRMYPLY